MNGNEYVFPAHSKSGHNSQTAIEKPFRNLRRTLKLDKDLVLYSGRHTFATDMLDRTGNMSWSASSAAMPHQSPLLGISTVAEGRGGAGQR